MPLQMVTKDALFCPLVVCDHCGQTIADARQGTYLWRVDDPAGAVRFVHKECYRAYVGERGGGAAWYAGELQLFPLYLGDNLALDWQPARALAMADPGR